MLESRMLNKTKSRESDSTGSCEKGIALLMVLWVLTVLMVVVLSFSLMSRTETHSTLSFKDGIEKKFLAEAGINRGLMEIFYRRQNLSIEGSAVWKTDGTPYSGQIGDGNYTVRITDESGKVDINTVPDVILKNIIINSGLQGDDADSIVDSIMDWKDADDLHRLHGVESDYYMSLPNPYKAKNANLDTLEELLLVKGVTPGILYGSSEKKGIIDFLTVNSKNSKININAAPKEVLMAIPGVNNAIADNIISYREIKDISNIQDVQGISGEIYTLMSQYVGTGGSSTFTLDSNGFTDNEKKGYGIRATVTFDGSNKYKYLYYKCPVNIKQ